MGTVGLLVLLFTPRIGVAEPPVRIGGSGWIGDAPTKVADALGYFNEADGAPASPRIEVVYLESGEKSLHALLEGELEIALVATSPLVIHLAHPSEGPMEPVILASVALSNQTHVIVSRPSGGIATPEDLEGRRIGMPVGTSAEYAWSRFVALHDLDPDSMAIHDVGVRSLGEALAADRVDAAVLWEPWASAVRERLDGDVSVFSTRSLHTVNWLLVADRSWIREHPAIADRVMRAYLRAVDLIQRDPARARALHAAAGRWPAGILADLEDSVIWNVTLDWSVLANMDAQLTWALRGQSVGPAQAIPPGTFLEPAPLLRTAPDRVQMPPYLYDAGATPETEPP